MWVGGWVRLTRPTFVPWSLVKRNAWSFTHWTALGVWIKSCVWVLTCRIDEVPTSVMNCSMVVLAPVRDADITWFVIGSTVGRWLMTKNRSTLLLLFANTLIPWRSMLPSPSTPAKFSMLSHVRRDDAGPVPLVSSMPMRSVLWRLDRSNSPTLSLISKCVY